MATKSISLEGLPEAQAKAIEEQARYLRWLRASATLPSVSCRVGQVSPLAD
jgi:hypothetical protein